MVRGGIEPPTPRFSGAQNGCNLANRGDLRVFGAPRRPWCGHDWSRLVTRVAGHAHRRPPGRRAVRWLHRCHKLDAPGTTSMVSGQHADGTVCFDVLIICWGRRKPVSLDKTVSYPTWLRRITDGQRRRRSRSCLGSRAAPTVFGCRGHPRSSRTSPRDGLPLHSNAPCGDMHGRQPSRVVRARFRPLRHQAPGDTHGQRPPQAVHRAVSPAGHVARASTRHRLALA